MMAALDLEAIKARADAATPGPWYRVGPPWNSDIPWVNAGSEDPHHGEFVCDLDPEPAGFDRDEEDGNELADAEFIAHAREDVPALVAEVERLTAMLDEVYTLHTDSPASVCPSCYRLHDVSDTDDGLVAWPCPTLRVLGIKPLATLGGGA